MPACAALPWVPASTTSLHASLPPTDPALLGPLQVNEHLSTRTFLVGNTLTLADVVIYGVTQPATVSDCSAFALPAVHLHTLPHACL